MWQDKLKEIIYLLENSDVNEIEASFWGRKYRVVKRPTIFAGGTVTKSADYESIGMAVSDDMVSWKRYGNNPVITKHKGICGDAQIAKYNDLYIMFYFGAFYKVDFAKYKEPVMVSSVDGVGTKLKVAFMMDRHNTVGQDLVNHCVNDIAVGGATPLYFMDYMAFGKLVPEKAEQIIEGFGKACRENNVALIGGETAEMPGL